MKYKKITIIRGYSGTAFKQYRINRHLKGDKLFDFIYEKSFVGKVSVEYKNVSEDIVSRETIEEEFYITVKSAVT